MTPAGERVRPAPSRSSVVVLVGALIAGLLIAAMDESPGFDATGITAGLLVIAAFVAAILEPRWAVVSALLVGLPVPLGALVAGSPAWPSVLLALVFPAAGAVAGWSLSRMRAGRG